LSAEHPLRPRRVAVIGAGIVGMSAALYLQRDGHAVTVLDPRAPGTGASFGNAGGAVYTSCAPLALPGILKQVPGMMLDPLGPMVLRWRYLPRIAPWLIELLRASRPERVEAISVALAALNRGAPAAWRDLARQSGVEELLRAVGWLKVYETDAGFAATAPERGLMTRRGQRFELLSADELRQLEPGLAPIFRHGFFEHESDFVANPGRAVERFAADFTSRGGRILRDEVTGFGLRAGPRRVETLAGGVETEVIVLAAGAWSRGLARQLGARVRLDTERGYHLMLPGEGVRLGRPTRHGEQGFVLSPMEQGIRIASQVEFAGRSAAARQAHAARSRYDRAERLARLPPLAARFPAGDRTFAAPPRRLPRLRPRPPGSDPGPGHRPHRRRFGDRPRPGSRPRALPARPVILSRIL
jgi:D-amino-acid dehydrogenase